MSKRDIKVILKDILDEVTKIEKFTKDVNYEKFLNDEMRYYAVIRCLEIIGEAVNFNSRIFWYRIRNYLGYCEKTKSPF